MSQRYVFLHVRPGFEEDAALELGDACARQGLKVKAITAHSDIGFIYATFPSADFSRWRSCLKWRELIFARQILWSAGPVPLPKDGDRVTAIISAIQNELLPTAEVNAFSSFNFETPDTDAAKELSGFCKSLQRPTENSLNKAKLLPKGKGAAHLPRLHLVLVSAVELWPTFSDITNGSAWPMGIPRLKFPPQAPSRSTLKLEEAFLTFLDQRQRDERLREGLTAVDLGACPGGWTFQLVRRGLHVYAVDNGMMDASLMKTGLVEHVQADAFRYKPGLPVDWLVCDVVEQPSRIASLIADWLVAGWCKETIFNLKLPMKKRWEEAKSCLDKIAASCVGAGLKIEVQAKQLYHNRKEVTCHIRVVG